MLCALRRLEDLIARYPLRGLKGPVGTQLDLLTLLRRRCRQGRGAGARDRRGRSASRPCSEAVGQVYPRSLDFDVVSAVYQLAAGPSSFATTLRLMAGHRARVGGLQGRPGGLLGHAAQDQHAQLRAHQRPARGAGGARGDGERARRRPMERGRRLVLGRAPRGAARGDVRDRRPARDVRDRRRRNGGLRGRCGCRARARRPRSSPPRRC